jgi:hypothetical protein
MKKLQDTFDIWYLVFICHWDFVICNLRITPSKNKGGGSGLVYLGFDFTACTDHPGAARNRESDDARICRQHPDFYHRHET